MGDMRRIVLSSGRMNRKGYRIPIEVINVSDYLANPVLLAEHNYFDNIGHMEDVRIEDGRLTGLPVFASTAKGQEYGALYAEKGINAVSMGGFVKLNAERDEALSFELWECSLTSVPADPGAVAIDAPTVLSAEGGETLSTLSAEVLHAKEADGYEYVTLNCGDELEEEIAPEEEGCDKNAEGECPAKESEDEKKEDKDDDADAVDVAEDESCPEEAIHSAGSGNINNQTLTKMEEMEKKATVEVAAVENVELTAAPASAAVEAKVEAREELDLNPAMPVMDTPQVRVSAQRASLNALVREKGMDGITEMLNGNDNEKLHVFDAIRNTASGRVFFDKLHLNIDNGGRAVRVNVDEYLNNRESLSAPLRDMQRLSMTGNARLNASTDFVENPALDRIAFSAMAYLKLFPTNLWTNRMPILPAQLMGDNVGVVWANIGFDSNITTQPAQTDTTVSPVAIVAKSDKAVSMPIYEHLLEPMLWKRYNRDLVAYDLMGRQWEIALNNLYTAMYDWDLFTLAQKIATTTDDYTPKIQGTSGDGITLGDNWVKVTGNTASYKGLTMKDVQELEAYFQTQNINTSALNPVINLDPALLFSLTQDVKVQNFLTRFVAGEKSGDLHVSYSTVAERQYLGVYDPATSGVLNPVTGTATSSMVQFGLGLVPEYILRGLASMEVYTHVDPTLYGEVYSAEIKTGIAPAYKNNLGAALIVPTADEE